MRVKAKVALLGISLILVLCACGSKTNTPQDNNEYRATVKIITDNKEYSVRIDEHNNLNYYEGEELKAEIDKYYTHNLIMGLPDTDKIEDLDSVGMIADNVYSADLEMSTAYINFLISNGYYDKYTAYTSKFIEKYLYNPTSNIYKRLIITSEYIVITNEESLPVLDIRNYLFS